VTGCPSFVSVAIPEQGDGNRVQRKEVIGMLWWIGAVVAWLIGFA